MTRPLSTITTLLIGGVVLVALGFAIAVLMPAELGIPPMGGPTPALVAISGLAVLVPLTGIALLRPVGFRSALLTIVVQAGVLGLAVLGGGQLWPDYPTLGPHEVIALLALLPAVAAAPLVLAKIGELESAGFSLAAGVAMLFISYQVAVRPEMRHLPLLRGGIEQTESQGLMPPDYLYSLKAPLTPAQWRAFCLGMGFSHHEPTHIEDGDCETTAEWREGVLIYEAGCS